MLYKLQKIFETLTEKTNGKITDTEHLNYLIKKLLESKLMIEHDIELIKKYIIDFPVDFEQFCCFLTQIYKLEIEKKMVNKINEFNSIFTRLTQFFSHYGYENFTNEDLYEILSNFDKARTNIEECLKTTKKIDFLLKNIRDEIQKILWTPILENIQNQNEINNPDFFIIDSKDYQIKMQQKIEYEYEIIRTKRIHYNADKIKILKVMKNKIVIEKANCADRDIPVECWKIPNNFFDNELISHLYYRCESLRELLLSKYFQKFIGFDDLNYEDFQLFFFEHIEKIQLIQLIKVRELSTAENSMLFRYLSKEILLSFRDLLYKSTHSFKFPLNLENFYFEIDQLRLFINNIEFGPPRKTILDSHDMIESKLLFSYGIILIQILALSNPVFNNLIEEISNISKNFSDLNQMQIIFNNMNKYEQILTNNLEDDFVISLIIECLISPYKAKLVFDEFYEKKNFFKDIFKDTDTSINNKKSVPSRQAKNMTKNEALNSDQLIVFENYYDDVIDDKNEMLPKRILTLNYLLIHPYYERIKFENNYISYLFKDMSTIMGKGEVEYKTNNLNIIDNEK